MGNKKEKEQNILVVDLGSGTSDISVLTIDDSVYEVRATGGDTHLGGSDLTYKLVDYSKNGPPLTNLTTIDP